MPQPLGIPFAAIDHRLRRGAVFSILEEDLARHVYLIGRSGAGKSTLLERLLVEQIQRGHGVGLIDPHGDLAERVLHHIPRSRTNDVVLFEPANAERPVGLNVLEAAGASDALLVSSVLSVFRKTFADFWGPRLEHFFRATLALALVERGATLLTAFRILVDDRYRAQLVARVRDPVARTFWTREFPQYPKAFAAEALSPVLNKLGAALSSPLVRNVVGQRRSSISIRRILEHGHIFIANVAKGLLGEDASNLLGALLLAEFQLAAQSRAGLPPHLRRPSTLYVDEFPSFATSSFAETLAEARKYGLALVLAHQHLAQLDDGLRGAVLGNVGTMVVFRVSAADARILGGETEPELAAADLARLGRHQIAVKLSVRGETTVPFTALTLPAPEVSASAAQASTVRRASQDRYGRPISTVERSLAEQLGLPT